jgi:hypothetical protein
MRTRMFAAAVALSAAIAAPSAFAGDDTAAMRAVRDKETGQLRAPTQDELKELLQAERANRKARGLPEEPSSEPQQVRVHANGMKSVVLSEDMLVSVVAERDADGKLVVRHADPADEHVSQPAPEQRPTE